MRNRSAIHLSVISVRPIVASSSADQLSAIYQNFHADALEIELIIANASVFFVLAINAFSAIKFGFSKMFIY